MQGQPPQSHTDRCRRTVDLAGPYVKLLQVSEPCIAYNSVCAHACTQQFWVPSAEPLSCSNCCRCLADAAYTCYWLGGKSKSLFWPALRYSKGACGRLCTNFWHKQLHCLQILPPIAYAHQPATNFNTRFVHVSLNKVLTHACPMLFVRDNLSYSSLAY